MAKDKDGKDGDKGGEIVPLKGKQAPIALPRDWTKDSAGPAFITSLDTSDKEARRVLFDAVQGTVGESQDWVNREIQLHHYIIHPVSFTDEVTGEEVHALRTVLITPQRQLIGFVSQGVLNSLRMIAELISFPPWEPAVKVILRRIKGKGANSYYRLDLVD